MIANTLDRMRLMLEFVERDARYNGVSQHGVPDAADRCLRNPGNLKDHVLHFSRKNFLPSDIYDVAFPSDEPDQSFFFFDEVSRIHPTVLVDRSGRIQVTEHRRL